MNINVVIASDHNGVEDKEAVKRHLFDVGINCIDLGPYSNTVSVDYTDYASQVANNCSEQRSGKGNLNLWHGCRDVNCGKPIF